ncbi:protein of unknown function [Thauera humireducens]|uniref:hypothetical protein n=1 Tax=Thauera humireducens TaxID=1134435 RepID=UPI002467A2CD|nr:hypothetical protein [Thauera humireducens]CAH1747492.1 protein of unknown function [Thauera humireducens]
MFEKVHQQLRDLAPELYNERGELLMKSEGMDSILDGLDDLAIEHDSPLIGEEPFMGTDALLVELDAMNTKDAADRAQQILREAARAFTAGEISASDFLDLEKRCKRLSESITARAAALAATAPRLAPHGGA